MSKSPEAVFMDQLYLAILDVGKRLQSCIDRRYAFRTTWQFLSLMGSLDMLHERRLGAMLPAGISQWDWLLEIETRRLANDYLCVIGMVFVEGKSSLPPVCLENPI